VACRSDTPCAVDLWRLTSADVDVVRRLLDGVSADTLYRRFQRLVRPADVDLSWVARLDSQSDFAIVASDAQGGEPLGLARAVRRDDWAEIAVTVVDSWQGRRIGTCLAHRLADELTSQGVAWLSGVVSLENKPALAVMRGLGARRVGGLDWGVLEMRATLPRPAHQADAYACGARGDQA
jgi:GNAT superfamily N-acetyltransferase